MDTRTGELTDEELIKRLFNTVIENTEGVSEEVVQRAKESWAKACRDAVEWHNKQLNGDNTVQDENKNGAT